MDLIEATISKVHVESCLSGCAQDVCESPIGGLDEFFNQQGNQDARVKPNVTP